MGGSKKSGIGKHKKKSINPCLAPKFRGGKIGPKGRGQCAKKKIPSVTTQVEKTKSPCTTDPASSGAKKSHTVGSKSTGYSINLNSSEKALTQSINASPLPRAPTSHHLEVSQQNSRNSPSLSPRRPTQLFNDSVTSPHTTLQQSPTSTPTSHRSPQALAPPKDNSPSPNSSRKRKHQAQKKETQTRRARWAIEVFMKTGDSHKKQKYQNALQTKRRKGLQIKDFLVNDFQVDAPAKLAAALFEASRKSSFVKEALNLLLPHMYQPSKDDMVCRQMVEQIRLILERHRLQGVSSHETKAVIQPIIASIVSTPRRGEVLPKKPNGDLFSPLTLSKKKETEYFQVGRPPTPKAE